MGYKITIDGPSGSGKSSIAKIISKNNNILFITSGIFYRACAFLLKDINYSEINLIKKKLEENKIEYIDNKIYINNNNIQFDLFDAEITKLASKFSKLKIVRNYVNSILNKLSENKDIIMDGRDIGTKVFPSAELKFFLKTSLIERSKRRQKEFIKNNKKTLFISVLKDIFLRDMSDICRKYDPLKIPKNAIIINTNKKSINDVVLEMQKYIDESLICKK